MDGVYVVPKTTDLEIIDKLALGPRLWDLAFEKGQKPTVIGELLRSEGVPISNNQIVKWARLQAARHGGELDRYIKSHIQKHLPEDLDALENLEKASLTNAKKSWKLKCKELSERDELVKFLKKSWLPELEKAMQLEGPDKDKQLTAIAAALLKQCFEWSLEELRWLSSTREERKIALDAIEVKLKYSKDLGGGKGASINIIQNQHQGRFAEDDQKHPNVIRINRNPEEDGPYNS